MDFEKIVAILIKLLEDQENANITYRLIPTEENKVKEEAG